MKDEHQDQEGKSSNETFKMSNYAFIKILVPSEVRVISGANLGRPLFLEIFLFSSFPP